MYGPPLSESNWIWTGALQAGLAEAGPDGAIQKKPNVGAVEGPGLGHMAEHLPIVAVQSEDGLDRLPVPARDVEPVGAPALVGAGRFDLAGVGTIDPPPHLARQHQVVDPHHPPDPLAVVGPLSTLESGPVDQPPDSSIPVAGPLLGHREDLEQDFHVLAPAVESRSDAAGLAGTPCSEPPSASGRRQPSADPSPTGSFEQAWTFFYQVSSRLEDLDGHRLLADQALELLDLLLELPNPAGRHDVLARRHGRRPAAIHQAHPVPQNGRLDLQLP